MPTITLRTITRESVKSISKLRVAPQQEPFVASNSQSMAEAHFAEDAWFRAIYADNEPVGFIMLSLIPERAEYYLWRLMIDARHQGRGYGREALALIVDYVRSLPNATALYTSHRKGAGSPEGFYLKMGFRDTGDEQDGEYLMKLDLCPSDQQVCTEADVRLLSEQFPRSSRYHPQWVVENSFGANVLWLTEWLASAVDLKPGMRVLDLGCGRAKSSVFLAREFGVQVWAADLWISASENVQRIRDAGVEDNVFPIHADARALPFAGEFFDAILSVDSFSYYGSDGLYLNYLAHFVKPGGHIGIAGAGLVKEFDGSVPEHLKRFWTQDCWGLHSADWWRNHWQRTGIMEVEVADTMPDGWRVWLDWYMTAHPHGRTEIETLQSDQGQYLGYIRMVGRRREGIKLEDYCWPDPMRSLPFQYQRTSLLRESGSRKRG